MKCRKNIRKLIQEYNGASAADKPNTTLMKFKMAILDLKNTAIRPSLIPEAQAEGAQSRYDDFIWVHHQVMLNGPNDPNGPNWAHRGPAFGPWHRELLKLYEQELQSVSGDSNMTIPYWNWTKDQTAGDPGYPFFTEFLGGDGSPVTTGDFRHSAGNWNLYLEEDSFGNLLAQPHNGSLSRAFGLNDFFGPGIKAALPPSANVRSALNITPYDSAPWTRNVGSGGSFRNTLEGWVGPSGIHNVVHVWIGGSMLPGTSPNDPVFFLHHNNIDRLWAVWQQKHPAIAQYLPDNSTASANGLTRLNDKMSTFGRNASDRYFGIDVTPGDVVNHKAIMWYDSDLPEIDAPDPSLTFSNIPQGLTTYKAVKFKIATCRDVQFRITGNPTGKFGLTMMGSGFIAKPDDALDFVYGYVWVKFDTNAAGSLNSSVDIEAYIIDEEGYYAAAENGEFHLANYHVDLIGTIIPRASNSVALVVDRSGSMGDPAGGGKTKSQLLVDAIGVFSELMLADDEISLSSFDDLVATPVLMQPVSSALPLIPGADLSPRNSTWIRGGMQEGAVQFAAATKTNKSMLVLTDGNENVHPYVLEPPVLTINNTTYAIGFGLPGTVSDTVLNEITNNTHGDLIVTGDISSDEQRFNLTKYFVQILAGVTKMNVILDPQGNLLWGSKNIIPFTLSDADVYADLITICPLPMIVDFSIQTPSGKIIKSNSIEPNVKYIAGQQVLCYRIVLPALAADPAGSHAGTWKAILSLKDRGSLEKQMRNKEFITAIDNANLKGSLPYSFVAHTYSNLALTAYKVMESLKPGAVVTLFASLKEYDIALRNNASVWADVTLPDKSTAVLKLMQVAEGLYSGNLKTSLAGVYNFRIRAEGYTSAGYPFTREKTITAGVYYGNHSSTPPPEPDHQLCDLLQCLLSEKVISAEAIKRLKEEGFDIRNLAACVKSHCMQYSKEGVYPKAKNVKNITGLNIKTAVAATPVKKNTHAKKPKHRKPMTATAHSMFSRVTNAPKNMFSRIGEDAPMIMDNAKKDNKRSKSKK